MNRFDTLSLTLSFIGLLCGPSYVTAAEAYPKVLAVQGKAWVTGVDGPAAVLKSTTILRGRALIETEAQGKVTIAWGPTRTLTVFPSSKILVPAIGWDSGEASVLVMKSGSIRWQAGEGSNYNVALTSDLFEFIAPPGDIVLTLEPEKAAAEVKVLDGRMEFTYLNGEETTLLQKGQKVGFQGVLEDGKISYDVLLKGRKVPKGKLTPVAAVTEAERRLYSDEGAKKRAAVAAQKAKEKAKPRVGEICDKPRAKFNECSWSCEGNPKKEKKTCQLGHPGVACVRQRCNANGDWSERAVIEGEKAQGLCKVQPRIAACDY